MATEKHFEQQVVQWLVDRLGYVQKSPSLVSNSTKLLEADLLDFVKQTHKEEWKQIVKSEYAGDEKAFEKEFCQKAYEHVYRCDNVFVRIGKTFLSCSKDRLTLHNIDFKLYRPPLSGQVDLNRYSVVPQLVVHFEANGQKITKRPDLVLYLNGIPFSLIELKYKSSGQSAEEHGCSKISEDYLQTVRLDIPKTSSDDSAVQPSSFYRNLVHALSVDETSVYSWRTLTHNYNQIKDFHVKAQSHSTELIGKLCKEFFKERIITIGDYKEFEGQFWQPVLYRLLRKEALCNEFEYNRPDVIQCKKVHGKKETRLASGNNKTNPRVPRPMQVFGIEKTMQAIIDAYQHEHIPNYELTKLESQLKAANTPTDTIQKILQERALYRNGIDHFSFLLQYAPGAGKSDIIGLLAGRLRHLRQKDVLHPSIAATGALDPLIDRIVICTDRLDLKSQMADVVHALSIDKAMVAIIDSQDALKTAIKSQKRIMIVNIQKFKYVKEWAKELAGIGGRTAFLIDEIHRSNTGEQHEAMVSIFEELAAVPSSESRTTKNLIVGFTATPTTSTLMKFGQFKLYPGSQQWEPLDAYTFLDAVNDGYILNPLEGLYSLGATLKMEEAEEGVTRTLTKTEMYEHPERIAALAHEMARYMISTTFNQIRKTGSAMVVAYSVKAAIQYYHALVEEFKAQGSTKPVYILYSDKEGYPKSPQLCGCASEEEVINNFRRKGGVIVVVDKLQTGFDEPKLHTLFLDKEVSGVAAVQTACRVNRVAPYKDSCVVIDCSIGNVNRKSIPEAFELYGDYVSTSTQVSGQLVQLQTTYAAIQKDDKFMAFFTKYKRARNPQEENIAQSEVSAYVARSIDTAQRLKAELDRMSNEQDIKAFLASHENPLAQLISLKSMLLAYVAKLNAVNAIAPLDRVDAKLVEESFLKYIKVWLNILGVSNLVESEDLEAVDAQLDNFGWIEAPPVVEEVKAHADTTPKERKSLDSQGLSSLHAVKEHIAHHGISDYTDVNLAIESYKARLHFIFNCVCDSSINTYHAVANGKLSGFLYDIRKEEYLYDSTHEACVSKLQSSLNKLKQTLSKTVPNSKATGLLSTIGQVPEYQSLPQFIDILISKDMLPHVLTDLHAYLESKDPCEGNCKHAADHLVYRHPTSSTVDQ